MAHCAKFTKNLGIIPSKRQLLPFAQLIVAYYPDEQ